MKKILFLCVSVLLVFSFFNCAQPEEPDDSLTEIEAGKLFYTIFSTDMMVVGLYAPSGEAEEAINIKDRAEHAIENIKIDGPVSGYITVNGTVNDAPLSMDLTIVYSNFCIYDITLNGNSTLTYTGTLENFTLHSTGNVNVQGAFEGDYSWDIVVTLDDGIITVQGNVGGCPINQSY